MAYHGKYQPVNPRKYAGDHRKIEFRSLWEMHFMRWCDKSPAVKEWNSEEVIIPYISTAQGDKRRRYFMDFFVKFVDDSCWLFEVKPKAECAPPRMKKRGPALMKKLQTFQINVDKWRAAKEYAEVRGWKFKVLHEDGLKEFGIRVNK